MNEIRPSLKRSMVSKVLDRIPVVGSVRDDLEELRRLLYDRRAPRVALVGFGDVKAQDLLEQLIVDDTASLNECEQEVWTRVSQAGSKLEVFLWDIEGEEVSDDIHRALNLFEPDIALFITDVACIEERGEALIAAMRRVQRAGSWKENLILPVVLAQHKEHSLETLDLVRQRWQQLIQASELHTKAALAIDAAPALETLSESILAVLPTQARVEAARTFWRAQKGRDALAKEIIQACSTISVTVALTPIPLSDSAILAPLQALMVSTIAYISGRSWNRKVIAEWLASVGIVGGAGLGLRWTAQQLAKFFPGAGNVVSATVAGGGTTAIGKSATAYFMK